MLRKYAAFVTKQRWVVIFCLILITLFFAYHIKNTYYENRMTHWFPKSDPVLRLLRETGDKFGTNELILVVTKPKSGDTFTADFLQKIQTLTDSLNEEESIFLATSLSNMSYITRTEWGLEVNNFLDQIPQEQTDLEAIKATALAQENYVGNILSADGRWLALAVYMKPNGDTITLFRDVIKPTVERYLSDSAEIFYSGNPSDSYYANRFTSGNIIRLVPAVVILILGVLYFSFRTLRGVLFPTLVVGISCIWVFGLMGLLRWPLSLVSPALPVFLVALGSAYGIHVVNSVTFRAGGTNNDSGKIREAVADVVVPVLLAGLTTVCGFASFATVKLTIVRDLGLFTAAGILFAIFIALTLIPAGFSFQSDRAKILSPLSGHTRFLASLSRFVIKRRFFILILSAALAVAFLFGIPKIEREIDFSKYFPKNSPPRQAFLVAQNNFGGAYPLTVYIKADNIKTAGVLRAIRRAENYIYSLDGISKPFSACGFIQELNDQLNSSYHIPESDRGVGNLWFFIEGRSELRQILTEDLSEALILAKASTSATKVMRNIQMKMQTFLEAEYSRGLTEYSLTDLTPAEIQQLRKREAPYIFDEIEWLVKHYDQGKISDLRAAEQKILEQLDDMPQPGDEGPLKIIEPEFQAYIHSEIFDFPLDEPSRTRLCTSLISSIEDGSFSDENVISVLRNIVPPDEYEESIAQDVAATLLYRVKEALRLSFAQTASSTVQEFISEQARSEPNLGKRIFGLFYELADDTVVLPSDAVPDIQGKEVPIERIEQSGFPATMTRLDFFLFLSQIQSLIAALVITFILMILIRRSVVLGAISLTPIVFTLLVIYGFFGFTGIRLDFASMMTAGVSIGVGIDYSIHFIHSVVLACDRGLSLEDAVRYAFLEKGRAILANSVAVIAGFAVLILSTLIPLRDFGGIMVGSMFLAAFSSLTTLPALIIIAKPRIRSKK